MTQYIPKSALVAEIEKLMYGFNLETDIASTEECFNEELADAKYQLCKLILSFIDTLEVKEVQEEPVSECKIIPKPIECYSNCENCPYSTRLKPVSEDLEEASLRASIIRGQYIPKEYLDEYPYDAYAQSMFKRGAKWQKENLWKPADGDDLPEIDREVIALFDNGKVGFAHRPPEYWDGKNIVTGKVTRNYPKTYDKGGWNIPNVKYWLDCSLPNMEED